MGPNSRFQGRKTSGETDWSAWRSSRESCLVDTDHGTGILNTISVFCKGQTYFLKMGMQRRSKGTEGTTGEWQQKWESMKWAVGIAGLEVSIWQRRQGKETKVRAALQAGGIQVIIILCLQNPFNTRRPVPFLASGLCNLSPGGEWPFDSNRLCCREPEAKWTLRYKPFQRKPEEQRMLTWFNSYLLTVTTAMITHQKALPSYLWNNVIFFFHIDTETNY